MKPMDPAYLLFTELLERVLAGDTLSPEDEVTYARLLAEHPHMREEATMMMELGDLEAAPSVASRRLADAALAALNREEDEVPSHAIRKPRRVPLALQAIMAAAAGFVVWLQVSEMNLRWWNAPTESTVASAAEVKASPVGARVELVYASGDARVINELDHESAVPSIEEGDIHGQLLAEGQTVQVDDGSACFVLDPGIDICMGGHSRLRIDTVTGKQRRFVLEQGRVSLQLAHQPRGFSVTVEAAGVDSTAVGTSYSVALDENATVQTTVLEGRVKVRRGAQVHMVDAHHRLLISKREAQETMLTRPQEAPEWAAIEATRLWQGRSPAVLHVEGSPNGAELLLDGHLVGKSPLTSLVPAGRHRISVREGATEHLVQEMTLLAGQRHNVRYDATAVTVASATEPRATIQTSATKRSGSGVAANAATHTSIPVAGTVPSAEDLLSEARRLLVQGRYAQSALTYEALRQAYPNSPEARTVLVALAQLELEHHHNPLRAQALLDQYLTGGPGPLTQEARHLRILSLRALGRDAEEQSAIINFLATHPGSFQEAALRARLGELTQQVPSSTQP